MYGFPDETADAVGQYIATLIVGMLNENKPKKHFRKL